jgi:hypothetical protein
MGVDLDLKRGATKIRAYNQPKIISETRRISNGWSSSTL